MHRGLNCSSSEEGKTSLAPKVEVPSALCRTEEMVARLEDRLKELGGRLNNGGVIARRIDDEAKEETRATCSAPMAERIHETADRLEAICYGVEELLKNLEI